MEVLSFSFSYKNRKYKDLSSPSDVFSPKIRVNPDAFFRRGHIFFLFFLLKKSYAIIVSVLLEGYVCATKCLIFGCLFRMPEAFESIHTLKSITSETRSSW